jgi:uncharacterized protein YkwD
MKKPSFLIVVLFGCCSLIQAGSVPLSPSEKEVLDLTNTERKKNDLPPLRLSPQLSRIARAHSENMAKQGKMDHELDGKNPFDRIRESGYRYSWAGENIAYGDEVIPTNIIMKGWMESKPHRENILNEAYSEIGVGSARDKEGRTFYTQIFGRPR